MKPYVRNDAQRFSDGSLAAVAAAALRAKMASPDAGVITEWYAVKGDLLHSLFESRLKEDDSGGRKEEASREGRRNSQSRRNRRRKPRDM